MKAKKTKPKIDNFKWVCDELTNAAAVLLFDGFDWSGSKEGKAYWKKIHDRLRQIAKKAASK